MRVSGFTASMVASVRWRLLRPSRLIDARISDCSSADRSASALTAAADISPLFASGFHSSERSFSMARAMASSRWMVLPDTLRPVCSAMISVLMSSVRTPLIRGLVVCMRSTSIPSAQLENGEIDVSEYEDWKASL